jgi:hypothetical protein
VTSTVSAASCALIAARFVHPVLEPVDERTFILTFVGRHRAERLEKLRDRALLAERIHADAFERRLVLGAGDGGERVGFELLEVGHARIPVLGLYPNANGAARNRASLSSASEGYRLS